MKELGKLIKFAPRNTTSKFSYFAYTPQNSRLGCGRQFYSAIKPADWMKLNPISGAPLGHCGVYAASAAGEWVKNCASSFRVASNHIKGKGYRKHCVVRAYTSPPTDRR